MGSASTGVHRPIVLAVLLTASGEAVIFIIFGVYLFPAGHLMAKAYWTGTCGLAMGLVIGAAVLVLERGLGGGRMMPFAGAGAYFAVLAYCVGLCFTLDRQFGYFGAIETPHLFVWSGLAAAALSAPVYAWCLYGANGRRLSAAIGLKD
jgi:hypothetical protein